MDTLPARHGEAYERVKNAGGRKNRVSSGNLREQVVHVLPIPNEAMLRTPSVTDSTGGAISEEQARERGRMVKTADQVAQLAFENGLKVSPAIADSLLPTPVVNDMGAGKTVERWDEWTEEVKSKHQNGNGHGASLNIEMLRLMPTPNTMDSLAPRQGEAYELNLRRGDPNGSRRERSGNLREVVFHDLLPTTRTSMANGPTQKEIEAGNPKTRLETEVMLGQISWGKFEPAIRRWEQTLNRPAPPPTKPDGKDGAHRLSSHFTEWMMGLPHGWITNCGLTRNEELKACGNGVVPQQAELALKQLLQGLELTPPTGGDNATHTNS